MLARHSMLSRTTDHIAIDGYTSKKTEDDNLHFINLLEALPVNTMRRTNVGLMLAQCRIPCSADFFVIIFHLFEARIVNAIPSFK